MSATAPASAENINGAQPPPRRWTLEQEHLAREFEKYYGIEPRQIAFESERLEPIFDYDALSVLSLVLAPQIVNMETEPVNAPTQPGVVMMKCVVTLDDGKSRAPIGSATIGEPMPGGGTIEDFKQALDVAQSRAVRKGLRAVAFDPLKMHQKKMRGEELTLALPPDPHRDQMAEIHLLAREAELITDEGNDDEYRKLMGQLFKDEGGEAITTATKLNEAQRSQFVATLRALAKAQRRPLDPMAAGRAERALHANAEAAGPRA